MFAERFSSTRMVLKTCPAWQAVEALAEDQGWSLVEDRTTASEPPRRREVRWDVRPTATVRFVEDDMSPHCWVVVSSPLRNRTHSLAQIVSESLELYNLQECERLVETATSPQNLVASLLRLGIAAPPEFDYNVFKLMAIGLTYPNEHGGAPVRSASMWAVTYSPYGEYRPLLEEIARRDPVEELRGRAQMVLEAFTPTGSTDRFNVQACGGTRRSWPVCLDVTPWRCCAGHQFQTARGDDNFDAALGHLHS